MASVAYDRAALEDLERLCDFLLERNPVAARTALQLIEHAIHALQAHPLLGRPVEDGLRELVISHGNTGYIALYHFRKPANHVQVRRIRHQREAGFEED